MIHGKFRQLNAIRHTLLSFQSSKAATSFARSVSCRIQEVENEVDLANLILMRSRACSSWAIKKSI